MADFLPPNLKFEMFVDSVKAKCNVLMNVVFPKNVEELTTLLDESTDFNWDIQQTLLHQEASTISVPQNGGAQGDATKNGSIHCSSVLSKQIGILQPYMVNLLEHANQLKLWVKLLTPKVEGGNNVDAEIQKMGLLMFENTEKQAKLYYKTSEMYHLQRAEILEKITNYLQVEDYRRAVVEWDEKHLFWLRTVLAEIRNQYAGMYDFTAKNYHSTRSHFEC